MPVLVAGLAREHRRLLVEAPGPRDATLLPRSLHYFDVACELFLPPFLLMERGEYDASWEQRLIRLLEKSRYYDLARQFARLVSSQCQHPGGEAEYVIVTGGGPGIMEAANRGAWEVNAKSVGLNIHLPMEQMPNPYITPDLCFLFRYFAMRKFHFLMRAKALVVFPGGYGTLDELFDAMTLRQTGRMSDIPIIMFGREYWERVLDFHFMADEGTIDDQDLDLFRFAETAAEAWDMIQRFHRKYGSEEPRTDY